MVHTLVFIGGVSSYQRGDLSRETRGKLLRELDDGKPHSHLDLVRATRLSHSAVWGGLLRAWKAGLILRTEKPIFERVESFRGRAGISKTTRGYHLYVTRPNYEISELQIGDQKFVAFSEKYLDRRGNGQNKSKTILNFLKSNPEKAFYSIEVVGALKNQGILPRDIMTTARRGEKKGWVYVRGYKTHDSQTPFKEGYILTWLDQNKPSDTALGEAIRRTDMLLQSKTSVNPFIARVQTIRNAIIECTQLKDMASVGYIQGKLDCTEGETDIAIERTLQLYSDLREVKLFNVYRYFYQAPIGEEDLNALIEQKKNYIRKVKSADNRIGHNWEAVAEWFVDKLSLGAKFWMQQHREIMDPRRITIHLVKPVRGRKNNAEVDRVWEVAPAIFAQPITYVLECKWGLVGKKHLDDFFEVLKWSKEFGVDSVEGRQVRQGVIGIFAGSSFNPHEKVQLRDGKEVSLAQYASRMNIQLLRAADFNTKLHEKGIPKEISVQKICRIARDEKDVRQMLEAVWENPAEAEKVLSVVMAKNKDVYEFEKMLEKTSEVTVNA